MSLKIVRFVFLCSCLGMFGISMVGCSGPETQVNEVAPDAAAKMEADQKAYEEEMNKPRVGP